MIDRAAPGPIRWEVRVDDAADLRVDWDGAGIRYDRGELLSAVRRADGSILAEGWAARAGVLEYRRADGSIRRELVTEDTLRNGLGTLARVPVTNTHPRADDGTPILVNADNVGEYGVGDVDGEVSIEEGGFVRVRMAVRRADALASLDQGRRELSPGYRVAIDETPGTHPVHGRYDAIQVARLYNHLALVDRARGGQAIRLRVDDAQLDGTIRRRSDSKPRRATVHPNISQILAILSLGDRTYADDDAALVAIASHLARRNDTADPALVQARADLATVTAERDAARVDLATVTAERDTLKADADARADAEARADLEGLARPFGVNVDTHPDLTGLRRAIAEAFLGAPIKADAAPAYVDALVDLARTRVDPSRGDGEDRLPDTGRARGRAAWAAARADADTDTDTRTDTRDEPRGGVGEINRSRYDAAFEAGRSGGGE